MSTRECKEGFREEGETTIKIKLWAVITGLVTLCGVLMGILYANDTAQKTAIDTDSTRITKLEVIIPVINSNLDSIRDELKAIRQQGRR